jgi:hypothetical protein
VFAVRDLLLHRCVVYGDPDCAGNDTGRYRWLGADGRDPSQGMP